MFKIFVVTSILFALGHQQLVSDINDNNMQEGNVGSSQKFVSKSPLQGSSEDGRGSFIKLSCFHDNRRSGGSDDQLLQSPLHKSSLQLEPVNKLSKYAENEYSYVEKNADLQPESNIKAEPELSVASQRRTEILKSNMGEPTSGQKVNDDDLLPSRIDTKERNASETNLNERTGNDQNLKMNEPKKPCATTEKSEGSETRRFNSPSAYERENKESVAYQPNLNSNLDVERTAQKYYIAREQDLPILENSEAIYVATNKTKGKSSITKNERKNGEAVQGGNGKPRDENLQADYKTGTRKLNTLLEDQLIQPMRVFGISDMREARVNLMDNPRVCYACSSANDVSCWLPNRQTTVKYCQKNQGACVTKTYKSELGFIVIRDCSDTCDVALPILDTKYASCSICKYDRCNDQSVGNGSVSLNNRSVLALILMVGLSKMLSSNS